MGEPLYEPDWRRLHEELIGARERIKVLESDEEWWNLNRANARQAARIATLEEREAQSCALLVRLYVASLKQDWEKGECLDEVTGDIRHQLANCGREDDLERALEEEKP